MRLIKYDNLYNDALNDLDGFFDRAFRDASAMSRFFSGTTGSSGFRVDMHQDADNYYVSAELPGVDKQDVKIELENAVLTITGSRKRKSEDGESTAGFSRSITVGDDISADKVKAKLENGILTITLPKKEERKPRTISVA